MRKNCAEKLQIRLFPSTQRWSKSPIWFKLCTNVLWNFLNFSIFQQLFTEARKSRHVLKEAVLIYLIYNYIGLLKKIICYLKNSFYFRKISEKSRH